MVIRSLMNASFAIAAAAGAALMAWVVSAVGVMRYTPPLRPWGSLAKLPRPVFIAYFCTLALTWSLCFMLLLSERESPYFAWLIAGPATVCFTLIVGWMVAAKRAWASKQN